MPSGFHSRGGSNINRESATGSHFSGGSPRNSRFRGSSRRVRPFFTGPSVVFIGSRGYSFTSKRQVTLSLLIVLLFFMVVLSFVGGMMMNSNQNNVEIIKADYEKYNAMIEYAESNPEYIVQGRITGIFLDEGHSKYFYTYMIKTQYGSILHGNTFYTYTLDFIQSQEYSIGTTIMVAVDNYPVTLETDSIPMDFKNFTIDDDEEYQMALTSIRNGKIMLAVGVSVSSVTLLVAIIVFFTTKKVEKANQTASSYSTSGEDVFIEEKLEKNVCPYCGTRISPNSSNCPNCGAPRQVK